MRTVFFALFVLALSRLAAVALPVGVQMMDLDWHDAARNRDVPVRIYYPEQGANLPVLIFSHGLGGSRRGYSYLGEYWAGHGYVSVHVQHIGSDEGVFKNGGLLHLQETMRKAIANPDNLKNRPLDIRFAIDQIGNVQKEPGPLKGRMALNAIGVGGHSFGSYTTLAVIGQEFPETFGAGFKDDRVKAGVVMSPMTGPTAKAGSFAGLHLPVYFLTGTKDESPVAAGFTPVSNRRVPFDGSPGPDKYLLIFDGGDHMVFSGRVRPSGAGPNEEAFHKYVQKSTTRFWDAYLKQDAVALDYLRKGGAVKELGALGTWEIK